ncbi:MAG: VWA domain-containing protein, partial [Myxococcales bacterium]|nr:VWA domain-containing protein [Myxococcales bacterium]
FITRRPHDRIGLVAFGSYASSVAPLTIDHGVLRGLLEKLQLGSIDGSRTAIGAGLGVALNRLDESEASSKIVVLVTDGKHNAGGINPDTAAEEAAERGVIVYTVLIGDHRMGSDRVDPAQLERIASITGGYAYTAKDPDALRTTFQDLLDKLERSTVAGEQVRAELFHLFLWPAFLLLLLDVLLRSTRLRRFP